MIRIVCTAYAILVVSASGAALADTRGDVRSGIAQCDAFTDDHAWLDCVDGVTQRTRARLDAQPIPGAAPLPQATPFAQPRAPSAPIQRAAPSLPQSADFGLREPPQQAAQRTPSGIRVQMAGYEFNRFGMFTVTLADGQVWQQIAGDTNQAHWSKPAAAYTANIRKAALGSFSLSLDGEGGAFKVRRVK